MNLNLNEAILDIAKAEAIMYAIENTYLDLDVAPAERKKASNAIGAFYALWDCIKKVSDDIDHLARESGTVDTRCSDDDNQQGADSMRIYD